MSETDKDFNGHNYLQFYDKLFAPYKESATTVLEIGVELGGSIELMTSYFKKAKVLGIDINEKYVDPEFVVDQGDSEQLKTFADKYGPFDIVIDDGSHMWRHQIVSFETLWPYIKAGGLYVVEDMLTSYSRANPWRHGGRITGIQYFKDLIDQLNWKDDPQTIRAKYPMITNKVTYSKYQSTIDYIIFKTNLVIIKKINNSSDLTY